MTSDSSKNRKPALRRSRSRGLVRPWLAGKAHAGLGEARRLGLSMAQPSMRRGQMPRFAANLGYLFADRPPLERFGAAAAAGFKAVELQFPYAHAASAVRREIERHGLMILGINTPLGSEADLGLAGVPGRERDFAALFRQALDYAVAIGGTAIHCMSGKVPPDRQVEGEKVFIANLTRAADLAGEKGISLLIEPINRRDRPDYLLHHPEQAAGIIAQIGRANVRMQFDFYHVQIEAGDLMTRFERHRAVIGHVQIAAVPSRAEPDEGEVNYLAIFDMLDRAAYAGYVGCEYRPRRRTEEGLGWGRSFGLGAPRDDAAGTHPSAADVVP
jgi:2-dehydrotetronate isomerase